MSRASLSLMAHLDTPVSTPLYPPPQEMLTTEIQWQCVSSTHQDFNAPLQSTSAKSQKDGNFFKGLKWSPDGQFLLTSTNSNRLSVFASNVETFTNSRGTDEPNHMIPGILFGQGEPIYDFTWYPHMAASDPATSCILASTKDHPVQLWNLYTESTVASYSALDHCEVLHAPNSLAFNLDGSKYASFRDH